MSDLFSDVMLSDRFAEGIGDLCGFAAGSGEAALFDDIQALCPLTEALPAVDVPFMGEVKGETPSAMAAIPTGRGAWGKRRARSFNSRRRPTNMQRTVRAQIFTMARRSITKGAGGAVCLAGFNFNGRGARTRRQVDRALCRGPPAGKRG